MNLLVRATCVVVPLKLVESSTKYFFFRNCLRWVVLPECITSRESTISLEPKVQLIDKTGVPAYYKLKPVKIGNNQQGLELSQ